MAPFTRTMVHRFAVLWICLVILPAALTWKTEAGPSSISRGCLEVFDTSGLPEQPNTFLEQQIREALSSHEVGNRENAAFIQRKLAEFYRGRGDAARAERAEKCASQAAAGPDPAQPDTPDTNDPAEEAVASGVRRSGTGLTGNFYGYEQQLLHLWDFSADGTFLHRTVARGVLGTGAGASERGRFRLEGDWLVLTIGRSATAFAAPALDSTRPGRPDTILAGAAEEEVRTVRLKFQRKGDAILLNEIELKPRSW